MSYESIGPPNMSLLVASLAERFPSFLTMAGSAMPEQVVTFFRFDLRLRYYGRWRIRKM